ncbi:MAG: hypothetical protein HY053_05550 [Proteobacteria bacterium]|nr:hypothetical protein [Pseudomonadota bacterium]
MKFSLPSKFDLPKLPGMPDLAGMPGKMGLSGAFKLNLRMGEASRYFSGSVFERAIMSMDKITLGIIGITWLVAILAMGGAFMAVKGAGSLKLQAETARAQEPAVPRITRVPLSKEQYEPLAARLKKQFPGLSYELTSKPALKIYSNNGEEFTNWLNAIGYADSMVASVRWNLTLFCAGPECPGEGLMQAELTAETITISQAEGGAGSGSSASVPTPATPEKK